MCDYMHRIDRGSATVALDDALDYCAIAIQHLPQDGPCIGGQKASTKSSSETHKVDLFLQWLHRIDKLCIQDEKYHVLIERFNGFINKQHKNAHDVLSCINILVNKHQWHW